MPPIQSDSSSAPPSHPSQTHAVHDGLGGKRCKASVRCRSSLRRRNVAAAPLTTQPSPAHTKYNPYKATAARHRRATPSQTHAVHDGLGGERCKASVRCRSSLRRRNVAAAPLTTQPSPTPAKQNLKPNKPAPAEHPLQWPPAIAPHQQTFLHHAACGETPPPTAAHKYLR